ncbi:hypothetical protein Patl1_01548 [Pistacia atlantica]|uniref:Uncharacterized protein n=1 Tax=Pistacia atlantica TaxID=434234 RepID=A0ACC1C4U2_9ROSI|nr:hypothetical protein Patl1_01548 [Pistacia atlantica]
MTASHQPSQPQTPCFNLVHTLLSIPIFQNSVFPSKLNLGLFKTERGPLSLTVCTLVQRVCTTCWAFQRVEHSQRSSNLTSNAKNTIPDVSLERIEEHTKRFIQVQEAYETLSDPISRALYDKQLALSSRKEELEEKREWRKQWQSQLTRLKRRSMRQDSRANMSWGARMRRRSNQN